MGTEDYIRLFLMYIAIFIFLKSFCALVECLCGSKNEHYELKHIADDTSGTFEEIICEPKLIDTGKIYYIHLKKNRVHYSMVEGMPLLSTE